MLSFLGFSKPKMTEETLKQHNIPIVKYEELKIDKQISAITGSGIFYKGAYKNVAVSIKIISIIEDTIINEFLYWDLYKSNNNFLQLQGACIKGNEVYLVFDFFAFTLETALIQNLITEDNRTNLVKQCLYILSILQKDGKKITDIRPGVFGITDNLVIKLLDFGMLINNDKLYNNDKILNERIKYQPPEYFNYQGDDLNYDIWSFGCLLIDIYSTENPIYKIKSISQLDLEKFILKGKFPVIPDDISSPMLKNILMRCFEIDYKKRINIEELLTNMTLFFDENTNLVSVKKYKNESGDEFDFIFDEDKKLKNCYDYAKEIDNSISEISNLIYNKYLYDVDILIQNVNSYHKMSLEKLEENYNYIINNIKKIYDYNIQMINNFKDKVNNKLMIMKNYYDYALIDINKTKKISDEIKRGIKSINKMENINYYNKLIETYEKSVSEIKINIQQYSKEKPYDLIKNLYYDNYNLVDMFKYISTNELSTLQNFNYLITNHNKLYTSDSTVKSLSIKLGIEDDIIEYNSIGDVVKINRYNEFYLKAQDNSNILIIYNLFDKTLSQINIPQIKFNSKSYSFYDKGKNIVYVSGGLSDSSNKFSYDNSFYSLSLKLDKGEYNFDLKTLQNMLDYHVSHTMTSFRDNFLICVGGTNTKNCEVYSKLYNRWYFLPELPKIVANPAALIFNGELYVFCGNSYIYNCTSGIYKMKLSTNFDKYIGNFNENNEIVDSNIFNLLYWENVDYYIDYGYLKRGMGICSVNKSIYLFGGFDEQYSYNNIYTIYFGDRSFFKDMDLKNVKDTVKNAGSGIFKTIKNVNFGNIGKSLTDMIIEKKDVLLGKKIITNTDTNKNINNNSNNIDNINNNIVNNNVFSSVDHLNLISSREYLPEKTYFNSNIMNIDDSILVMIDNMNKAYEFNLKTKEFFCYS